MSKELMAVAMQWHLLKICSGLPWKLQATEMNQMSQMRWQFILE